MHAMTESTRVANAPETEIYIWFSNLPDHCQASLKCPLNRCRTPYIKDRAKPMLHLLPKEGM